MALGASRMGLSNGIFWSARGIGAAIAILATVWPVASANAAPLLAQAGAPAGGGSSDLMKYAPSYLLMALLVGLGTFIVCRPRWGVAAKTAAK